MTLTDADIERDKRDAARYRWLRPRLEVRNQRSVRHDSPPRLALEVRVAQSFMDNKTYYGKGYTDPTLFDSECEQLDAAIDAAMREKGHD